MRPFTTLTTRALAVSRYSLGSGRLSMVRLSIETANRWHSSSTGAKKLLVIVNIAKADLYEHSLDINAAPSIENKTMVC